MRRDIEGGGFVAHHPSTPLNEFESLKWEGKTRMTTRLIFVLAILLAVVTQCFASDLSCSGPVGGGATVTNINGDVSVSHGKSCTLRFMSITGNGQ